MVNTKNTCSSPPISPRLLDLFPCHGEDLTHVFSSASRNGRVVVVVTNTQNPSPSRPTTPRPLGLFPCQGGDLERVVSSATRNETLVSLAHLRNISKEDRDIEIANNVSTELTLSIKPDIWEIKKPLTTSDVGSQTRLIIPKESVIEHILKYFTKEEIRMVEDEDNPGLRINVFDSDSKTTHQLCFKRWKSTGSYVLNNNWNKDFVLRKNLRAGDNIGLFWNPYASRLHFCVLSRSNH